jgi:uroporphyrinogen III methyltransferase/synthase
MGGLVDEVTAYKTIPASDSSAEIYTDFINNRIDLVTFTSSSTVKNFRALFSNEQFADILPKLKSASIGPITGETAEETGITPDITAEEYTIDGLVESILKLYET